MPSTLILKAELLPPMMLTDDKRSFWSLSLKILKDRDTEPEVVNTVSNFRVSAEKDTRASAEVIKLSFLQEKKIRKMDIESIPRVFIEVKNKTKRAKEEKRLGVFQI